MNINEFKKAFNCNDLDDDEVLEKIEVNFGDTDPMLASSYVFAIAKGDDPYIIITPKHFFQENDCISDDLDIPVYELLPELELESVTDATYVWDLDLFSLEDVAECASEAEMEDVSDRLESLFS